MCAYCRFIRVIDVKKRQEKPRRRALFTIYEWRKEGASLREIVRRLMDKGSPAPRGGKTWHIEAIRRILTNEKYYGDVCLQKTYIADYFTGKQVPNRGERDFYLLRDHHTAIIPKCK